MYRYWVDDMVSIDIGSATWTAVDHGSVCAVQSLAMPGIGGVRLSGQIRLRRQVDWRNTYPCAHGSCVSRPDDNRGVGPPAVPLHYRVMAIDSVWCVH